MVQTRYNEEDERAIVNGAHTNATLQQLVHKYVELFVLCPNCRLPESSESVVAVFLFSCLFVCCLLFLPLAGLFLYLLLLFCPPTADDLAGRKIVGREEQRTELLIHFWLLFCLSSLFSEPRGCTCFASYCSLLLAEYKIKGDAIYHKCYACGAKEMVDMSHKLCTYIVNTAKKAKKNKDKEKEKDPKEKKREKKVLQVIISCHVICRHDREHCWY